MAPGRTWLLATQSTRYLIMKSLADSSCSEAGFIEDQHTVNMINVFVSLVQRTRGHGGLSTVFEIAGPESAASPPRGNSPPAGHTTTDFNAAAYLQRKSALTSRERAGEPASNSSWGDPLDHRIHQSPQHDSDSELQFEDCPLLDQQNQTI